MSITAKQAADDLKPRPRELKRDRVARYLVANDRALFVAGVTLKDVAASCDCSWVTARAGRDQVASLALFWPIERRWRKLRAAPLSLTLSQWRAIEIRLRDHAGRLTSKCRDSAGCLTMDDDAIAFDPGGLKIHGPAFATRWLIRFDSCPGLTVATVAAAGRAIGWDW